MGINETKEAELTIEDDFPFPSLQNRRIRVKQTVIDIKYRDLPPLDDEFARLISSKQTLAELEEFLRQQAIERADELTQENIETALSNALVQITTVDLPETIISFHTNQVIREIMATMADSLGVEPNLLVEQLTAEMIGEMKEAAREQAIVKAKAELGLQQLAKLENLVIPTDLYQETMRQIREATEGKIPRDSNLERSVNKVLYRRLAMDWLKANAKIELVPEQDVEQEEAEEKPESPDLVHNTDS
jgi:trigger factor